MSNGGGCNMDPNETAQKLLQQDSFHEVRRKRVGRKENVKESAGLKWKPGTQNQGNRGERGPDTNLMLEVPAIPDEARNQDAERTTLEHEKKLEEICISDSRQVIIPKHIHVPEVKNPGFIFGSFDANFGLSTSYPGCPENEKSSPIPETSKGMEENPDQTSNHNELMSVEEEDYSPASADVSESLIFDIHDVSSRVVPEGGDTLILPTSASTPPPTQAAGVVPSSVAVTQQTLPVFGQPTGQQEESVTHIVDYTVSDVTKIRPCLSVVKGKISSTRVNMNMSIVGFPGKMKAGQHHKLASNHPFTIPGLQLMYEAENSTVISMGHDCGTPLHDFVTKQGGHFWEYDPNGMYIRPAKVFRHLGKLVGSLLYQLHKEGICIGGSMESIFVNGDGVQTPYYLTVMGPLTEYSERTETPGFSMAVWDDLHGFVKFVEYVETVKPRMNPQKPHNLFDLKMFYSLLPTVEDRPSSYKDIKKMSYFMCHTSLFWDYDQRLAFCSCFYQLRKQDSFDSLICFDKYNQMDGWYKKVETGVLRHVYHQRKKAYKKKRGWLILFWRHSLVHCVKDSSLCYRRRQAPPSLKATDVDKLLTELFPYAMPIAYFEMCKTYSKSQEGLVRFLCHGGLDYSR